MHGLSFATIDRVISLSRSTGSVTPPTPPWDSIESSIRVAITIPVLMSQCIQINSTTSPISTLTIQSHAYSSQFPILPLNETQVVAQLTADTLALIPSFGTLLDQLTRHCPITLSFVDAGLLVQLSSPRRMEEGMPAIAYTVQTEGQYDTLAYVYALSQGSIRSRNFAEVWMAGTGWTGEPTEPMVISFINNSTSGASDLELYTLALLGSAISSSFPSEEVFRVHSSQNATLSIRSLAIHQRKFYLGLRSPLRSFFVVVKVYNSVGMLGCLTIIIYQGCQGPRLGRPYHSLPFSYAPRWKVRIATLSQLI